MSDWTFNNGLQRPSITDALNVRRPVKTCRPLLQLA